MKSEIDGRKIKLRQLKLSDTEVIYQYAKNRKITKYTFVFSPPFTIERAEEFIKKTQRDWGNKKSFEFGIELKESKELIGTINLSKVNFKNKEGWVGFWISNKYWGKGLAKEALDLILKFAFYKLKLAIIKARVLHKNRGAQKLLEKTGFKLEKKLEKKTFFKKQWFDDLIYVMERK